MIVTKISRFVCFALLFQTSVLTAGFFSVDVASDSLVTIDTSGQVSVIGSLGVNLSDTDLAMLNGNLYAIDQQFFSSTSFRADLYQINTTSGAATALGEITLNGQSTFGHGLTSKNGVLFATYGTSLPGGNSFAPNLGELSLAGTLSNSVLVGNISGGLGTDSTGQIYSISSTHPTGETTLYQVPSGAAVGSNSSAFDNDLDFLGGDLYTISTFGTPRLNLLNNADGSIISTANLNRAGEYRGLAASQPTVPEPASIALFGMGSMGLLAIGRRRKKRTSNSYDIGHS